MIAIINQGGAFLYNCNFSEGQKRVKASLEIQRKHQYGDYSRQCLGSLDYDENGNMRKEDGMCGWLFSTKDLISQLVNLKCEAIFVFSDANNYRVYRSEDYHILKDVYEKNYKVNNKDVE